MRARARFGVNVQDPVHGPGNTDGNHQPLSEIAMTTITLGRTFGLALLAVLSATLMTACGGGDHDGEDVSAAAESASFEAASAHASRSQMGGGRLAPICTFATPDCAPKVPPTQ
jgi:hypothetical protein